MLTIQLFSQGAWQDAARLEIANPEDGRFGAASLSYDEAYSLEWLEQMDQAACSLRLPIELFVPYQQSHWFSFLDDIMPAGASRRFWVNQLNLGHLPPAQQDYQLLAKGSIAPIGNMRIKESLPIKAPCLTQMRFTIEDVVERHSDFLEYAQQRGAAAGGATGAGGEAPKLLIRLGKQQQVWIDPFQDELDNLDQHYLVKFPRGQRSVIDCDILRAEYHYYHTLAELGLSTISTEQMKLIEGKQYPSLWLPRFDVRHQQGQLHFAALESIYSALGLAPGSLLDHFDVIAQIKQLMLPLTKQNRFDFQRFVIEWLERDFLNVCFGNADNHGRNHAFLKTEAEIALSPIYDFAPMKADPEGITRSIQWGLPFERGGVFDWLLICHQLSVYVPAEVLIERLQFRARQLVGLKEKLIAKGVPDAIIHMPNIGFDYLDQKLQQWGLLA